MSNLKVIKVLLVEDNVLYRKSTKLSLNAFHDIEVIGECSDGMEVANFIENNRVDLILMDIGLTEINGIETTRLVKQMDPNICVIALTSRRDVISKLAMEIAGASEYLDKSSNPNLIKKIIDEVMSRAT